MRYIPQASHLPPDGSDAAAILKVKVDCKLQYVLCISYKFHLLPGDIQAATQR